MFVVTVVLVAVSWLHEMLFLTACREDAKAIFPYRLPPSWFGEHDSTLEGSWASASTADTLRNAAPPAPSHPQRRRRRPPRPSRETSSNACVAAHADTRVCTRA